MDLEENILARVKKLPLEKRQKVLEFVERMEKTEAGDGDDFTLAPEDLKTAWDEWVTAGPQGPIEDDGAPDFP